MLHDGQQALAVDPGDSRPVLDFLQQQHLQLDGILITHHHADHTGGVAVLRKQTGAKVYGPAREAMPEPLQRLQDGNVVTLLGLRFTVMDVPGHTAGHIAYYCDAVNDNGDTVADNDAEPRPLVFCGDTLFSAGCGRLFEGTPAQMKASLQRLSSLPATTRVCCTHEYTLSNLKFARMVEPDNQALAGYQQDCIQRRAAGLSTLPSTMALERAINPFLRSDTATVLAAVQVYDALGVQRDGAFAVLRQWKNKI